MRDGMVLRTTLVVTVLVGAVLAEQSWSRLEATVARESLQTLPLALDGWHGRAEALLTKDVVALLGVDEHVYRTYVRSGVPVNLYVGYYNQQKRGDTIHSPQNCLPGAGWQFVDSRVRDIQTPSGLARVNQYVIQKGLQKQMVLYWYQGRGRVVANEYENKALLMWDAATKARTSGGLVRIITPVLTTIDDAAANAASFAAALLPRLEKVMP